jgi:hypothetical protein
MSADLPGSNAAGRSTPVAPPATPQGCPRCHEGYIIISHVRPTVYCGCLLGRLANAMDEDPLNHAKAERWERACRAFPRATTAEAER